MISKRQVGSNFMLMLSIWTDGDNESHATNLNSNVIRIFVLILIIPICENNKFLTD